MDYQYLGPSLVGKIGSLFLVFLSDCVRPIATLRPLVQKTSNPQLLLSLWPRQFSPRNYSTLDKNLFGKAVCRQNNSIRLKSEFHMFCGPQSQSYDHRTCSTRQSNVVSDKPN